MQGKFLFLLMAGFLFLWSCEKEEEMIKPAFDLVKIAEISSNSAKVSTEMLVEGSEEVTEAGFIWKTSGSNISITDPETEKAPSALNNGGISTTITDLEAGQAYFIKAYVRTKKDTYYSQSESFNTLAPVQEAPVLETISPTTGIEGTEVILTGKFFGSTLQNTEVLIGNTNKNAEIIETSESEIKFIAPTYYTGPQPIKVTINRTSSTNSLEFEYFSFFSYSSTEVRAGRALTITQSSGRINNIYKINGIVANQKWTWTIPNGMEIGLEIPQNFPPGEVTIEGESADGKPIVNITGKLLTILPGATWTQKQDFPDGKKGNATGFAIQGTGYVIIGRELYSFNPASDSWTLKISLPFYSTASFVTEEKAYFLVKTNLWCFDPAANTLDQKAGFPGTERNNPTAFSNGIHGYFGLGNKFNNETNMVENYSDFWKYNPTSDSWTQLPDFPASDRGNFNTMRGIHFNNLGYLLEPGGSTWTYDYTSETFTKIESPIYALGSDTPLFALNNKLYFGRSQSIFEYDPVKNTAIEEPGYPGRRDRKDAFSFVVNGKAYVGAGWFWDSNNNSTDLADIWEFIPGG